MTYKPHSVWVIDWPTARDNSIQIRMATETVADVYSEDNARLIAAAPDLLTALERILRAHESGNNGAYMGEANLCHMFATQARLAIEKATKP